MREGYAVQVLHKGETILTIERTMLSGKAALSDERPMRDKIKRAIDELGKAADCAHEFEFIKVAIGGGVVGRCVKCKCRVTAWPGGVHYEEIDAARSLARALDRGDLAMWVWGKLAIWALRMHIARELRPMAETHGISRAETIEASRGKLRAHFDAAWPVEH